jgi:hypothetical protein
MSDYYKKEINRIKSNLNKIVNKEQENYKMWSAFHSGEITI